ncbi:hypothetical protein FB451DRAFT_1368061 [Mycena latifolia]|nr:hypothetical protein FB451DRAFT_1368061 [Mycena latifolia]
MHRPRHWGKFSRHRAKTFALVGITSPGVFVRGGGCEKESGCTNGKDRSQRTMFGPQSNPLHPEDRGNMEEPKWCLRCGDASEVTRAEVVAVLALGKAARADKHVDGGKQGAQGLRDLASPFQQTACLVYGKPLPHPAQAIIPSYHTSCPHISSHLRDTCTISVFFAVSSSACHDLSLAHRHLRQQPRLSLRPKTTLFEKLDCEEFTSVLPIEVQTMPRWPPTLSCENNVMVRFARRSSCSLHLGTHTNCSILALAAPNGAPKQSAPYPVSQTTHCPSASCPWRSQYTTDFCAEFSCALKRFPDRIKTSTQPKYCARRLLMVNSKR